MEIALHLTEKNAIAQTLVTIGGDTSELELHLTGKYEVAEALVLVQMASYIDEYKYERLLALLDVLADKRKLTYFCDICNAEEQLEMEELDDEELLERADKLLELL